MTPQRSLKTLLLVPLCLVGAHQVEAQPQSVPKDSRGLLVPVTEKCKYKMDETGNCLSPEFYRCTEDWAKCSKACKPDDQACQEVCDTKYSAICGD